MVVINPLLVHHHVYHVLKELILHQLLQHHYYHVYVILVILVMMAIFATVSCVQRFVDCLFVHIINQSLLSLCIPEIECEYGSYKSLSGSSSCQLCPMNSNTTSIASTSLSSCICSIGYSGIAGGSCSGTQLDISCHMLWCILILV
jgi:hypothetical protein